MGLVYYHKNFIWGNRFKHYHHEKKMDFISPYLQCTVHWVSKKEKERES